MSNRVGEESYNNFGSKMIIIEYRKYIDIDIYFPEYDCIVKNKTYDNFEKGRVKCPYETRVFGKGYIGEGEYKSKLNGKTSKPYETWKCMLGRCYDPKYHEKYPTYKDCQVCEEWLDFQVFAKWWENNYYEVGDEKNVFR